MYLMKKLCILMIAFCLVGCYRVPDKIEPQFSCPIEDRLVQCLPGPFAPLTSAEKAETWGKEYTIGIAFAKELDLYRAITAFKRAAILMPVDQSMRRLEIHYDILLSYYLGKRYTDVIENFECGPLSQVDNTFAGYHDLLIILFDSYDKVNAPIKAEKIYELIKATYPDTAARVHEGHILLQGNIDELSILAKQMPNKEYLTAICDCYALNKKSVAKAQIFNAAIPGAGYFYVGQKQSAVTALLLNSAFITAAVLFFKHGNIPAGIITTSLEAGWYFGGIYGAGESAKLYNERLYEQITAPSAERECLYPALRLRYTF